MIERTFKTAMVHQGYIEPHNAVGIYNADGHATIYCSTQGSLRNSHRGVMPCIWGTDLVVVARLRAPRVPRLSLPPPAGGSAVSALVMTGSHP